MKWFAFLFAFVVGCSTPYTPLSEYAVIKGDKVIYLEQTDRIPKAVLLSCGVQANTGIMASAAMSVPIDVIKSLLDAYPDVAQIYSNERMNNALIGRRLLFRGYDTVEELLVIERIIKAFSSSIENWTPQK